MTITIKKTWLLVSQIFTMISGICMCLTIVGAVLGVPSIMASVKFGELRNLDDETLKAELKVQKYLGLGL